MTKICPACGAEAGDDQLVCSFCGSNMVPVALPIPERDEVLQLIRKLNGLMAGIKTKIFRQADLLMIAAWLVGIVLILVAGFALHSNNIQLGMLLYSALVLLIWRSFRQKRLDDGLIRFFHTEVDPQINQIIIRLGLPRWQFDQMAADELNEKDPLHKFLLPRTRSRNS